MCLHAREEIKIKVIQQAPNIEVPPQGTIPEMSEPQGIPMRPRRVARKIIPGWLTKRAIVTYVLALGVVTIIYQNYCLPWYYMLSGVVSVLLFFIYGSTVAQQTSVEKIHNGKNFEKRIFFIAFVPRLIWVILIYYIFMKTYGDAFGFENADAAFYNEFALDWAKRILKGEFFQAWHEYSKNIDISDMGYATYIGFIYSFSKNSVFFVRLLKCIWSSLTVVLLYRLAQRNFGEQTARVAAIFCALWPNFWYYCGAHLKEVEMVFLTVLFVEQTDQMLRSRQFTAWKVIPVLSIAAILFTIRTPLALIALLSLTFSLVMSTSRVVKMGKRIVVGILAVLLIWVVLGNRIHENANELLQRVQSNEQKSNMEWRTRREHGNDFAKYAGSAVFAPLIFTIPFPSAVRPFEGQDVQQLLNGGNFIKNIFSFFTILSLLTLFLSGRWRDYLLPLSFMTGYLIVLVFSTFAQSERFHQPVMPFEIMFAAYGLGLIPTNKRYKRWFGYWCVLMFVAFIAWNWFKLAGRGFV